MKNGKFRELKHGILKVGSYISGRQLILNFKKKIKLRRGTFRYMQSVNL